MREHVGHRVEKPSDNRTIYTYVRLKPLLICVATFVDATTERTGGIVLQQRPAARRTMARTDIEND